MPEIQVERLEQRLMLTAPVFVIVDIEEFSAPLPPPYFVGVHDEVHISPVPGQREGEDTTDYLDLSPESNYVRAGAAHEHSRPPLTRQYAGGEVTTAYTYEFRSGQSSNTAGWFQEKAEVEGSVLVYAPPPGGRHSGGYSVHIFGGSQRAVYVRGPVGSQVQYWFDAAASSDAEPAVHNSGARIDIHPHRTGPPYVSNHVVESPVGVGEGSFSGTLLTSDSDSPDDDPIYVDGQLYSYLFSLDMHAATFTDPSVVTTSLTGPKTANGWAKLDYTFAMQVLSPYVSLSSVTFAGNARSDIVSDPEPNGDAIFYRDKHWFDANQDGDANDPGDSAWPVLYRAGGAVELEAEWDLLSPLPAGAKVMVQGFGPDDFDIPKTEAEPVGDTGIKLPPTALDKSLGSVVAHWPEFAIDWEISLDGGSTWLPAGTSSNPLYVAATTPATPSLYHTVVDLAVRNNIGRSASERAAIISGTWAEFADRDVSRADGTKLHYYQSHLTKEIFAGGLLATGDAQCGAWVRLFLEALAVNGVTATDSHVWVKPIDQRERFLIDHWDFVDQPGLTGDPKYPYLNVIDKQTSSGWLWQYAQVEDSTVEGLKGQSADNPLAMFQNHQLAHIDGVFYDPSYGRTYTNPAMEMDQLVDGFLVEKPGRRMTEATLGVDLNGNGNRTDVVRLDAFFIRKNDPDVTDLTVTTRDGRPVLVSPAPAAVARRHLVQRITMLRPGGFINRRIGGSQWDFWSGRAAASIFRDEEPRRSVSDLKLPQLPELR